MENKYYTPCIDEFHVGFEYEFKHSEYADMEWKKYTTPQFNLELEDWVFGTPTQFRVKYLDRKDIEDLGFNTKLFPTTTVRGSKFINVEKLEDGKWCEGQVVISLRKFLKGKKWPHISIRKYDINDPDKTYNLKELENIKREYLFQGFIKNKSELKKLLNQLEIQ